MEKESAEELVEISLNYKGLDLTFIVPLVEAEILLNDDEAAANYVEKMLKRDDVQESKKTQLNLLNSVEGTQLFLSLRKEHNEKFNDKKTLKTTLWQKIALELNNKGYDIPKGREGGEKCRQKFANLQRRKRDPPPFFNELQEILGDKDKVNPPYLEDSLSEPTIESESSSSSCEIPINSRQKEIRNRLVIILFKFVCHRFNFRFSSTITSLRPTPNSNKILELLKNQHEEIQKDKRQYMNLLQTAINTQNEQRERFLNLFERNLKKRRHSSSSSE
ncbi:hypothetical protein ABEB36_014502 [Hypothenemus hampei]|uniref:Myb/SANT-like DNA-binding domain-containing protein n=1 Tax=Hypothenemus hampei TaxID=57062 RepID=A0ABD1E210_HYPHA